MNVFGPDRVVLDMPRATYSKLLWALGLATGAASKGDRATMLMMLALANELNEGNQEWTPYAIDAEPKLKEMGRA